MNILIFLCLFLFTDISANNDEKEEIETVKIGNLALPTSQMPGPLVSFGQNTVDKGDLQAFVFPDILKGKNREFVEVAPSILYGIRDDLSIFIEFSVAAKFKEDGQQSHGIEDTLIQFEYTFYNKQSLTYIDQATIVTGIVIPTGSAFKIPPTGFGSLSIFLGATASHTATDWYYFVSPAALLTTSHRGTKFGNIFFYQAGLGKNISYVPDKWIFTWMVEFDGTCRQRDRILGSIDPDSGGNTILLGPSLWFSTQHLILQAGISWVISQHLFGIQNKDTYFASANIGWKFN